MGDMNDVPGTTTVRKIKFAGLKDAWWQGGCGYGSTYHDGWIKLRIDYVFYDDQQLKLKYVDVIGEKEWSDHRAIIAGFDLRK
jgi:endonuclease/exonuclease/phosphatase (EEP) superfamily protein YafD